MPRYYEFEVSLQEIQPRIWRRFALRTTATFAQLHHAIQESFSWQDYHLWEFRLPSDRGRPIAGLITGEEYDRPPPDGRTVKLNTYFTGTRTVERCAYFYDFGDSWTHDVKLIAVRTEAKAFKRILIDGDRAGPPEDCGGTGGYERAVHFVETGKDAWGDDPRDLAIWLDGWRPDAFDLAKAKAEFDR
jgi:hypothetical protein